MGARRGFSLLEVMVAVAILGLALTVILSAQAGLYASGSYAQHVSVANGLLRCKMTDLEERLLKYGYPLSDENDEGPCCEDDTRQDMRCSWKVETVTLPQPMNTMGGDAGLGSLASALGSAAPASSGASPLSALSGLASGGGASGLGGLGPLGALAGLGANPTSIAQAGDGGISALAGALGGGASGGMGTAALAPLVMTMVYPSVKPMLEASIRKLTVKISWKEGIRTRDYEIVQYVTNPVKGGLLPGMPGYDPNAPGAVPSTGLPTGTGMPGTMGGRTMGR